MSSYRARLALIARNLERALQLIADPTTTVLYLSLDVDGVREAMRALATNNTIKELNVGGDSYLGLGDDDDFAKVVAEAMERNETPPRLCIYRQHVGDEGAKALARAIETNTSVTQLRLRSADVGDEGVKALAGALVRNHTLWSLDLYDSARMTDEGAAVLVGALSKSFAARMIQLPTSVSASFTRRIYVEWKRGVARRRVLAMSSEKGVAPHAPLGRFLRADGDHAVSSRVLGFLMPPLLITL